MNPDFLTYDAYRGPRSISDFVRQQGLFLDEQFTRPVKDTLSDKGIFYVAQYQGPEETTVAGALAIDFHVEHALNRSIAVGTIYGLHVNAAFRRQGVDHNGHLHLGSRLLNKASGALEMYVADLSQHQGPLPKRLEFAVPKQFWHVEKAKDASSALKFLEAHKFFPTRQDPTAVIYRQGV